MNFLYRVQYVSPTSNDKEIVGLYTSCEAAREVVKRHKASPSCKDLSACFHIDKYELDIVDEELRNRSYPTGPGSEFSAIKKWADSSFE